MSLLRTCSVCSSSILCGFPPHFLVLGNYRLGMCFWKGGIGRYALSCHACGGTLNNIDEFIRQGLASEAVHILEHINVEKIPPLQQAALLSSVSPVCEGQEVKPWPWIRNPLGQCFLSSFPRPSWLCILFLLGCRNLRNEELQDGAGYKRKWSSSERKTKKWKGALRTGEIGPLQ